MLYNVDTRVQPSYIYVQYVIQMVPEVFVVY